MPNFIVNENAQSNGDHEVHLTTCTCSHMPASKNQTALGFHSSCHGAISKAREKFPNWKIDGCFFCCRECHTS
jgi:hypothetical protein